MTLWIGKEIDKDIRFMLPREIVTHTMAVLAKKRAGKSYAAGVIEEEMAKAGFPFVVLDPVGVHYGIRSTRDGKRPSGFPVVVFGGSHGDIPIDEHMGQPIAQAIVDENISCIIDLSQLSKGAWRRFVRDFCISLFKIHQQHKTPRHVFIEEATEFVPQTRRPEMQEAFEAVERLVRLGGNFGLGVTLIAQRSAQVAKDVLTQLDVLMVLRTVGKQDRKAVLDTLADVVEERDLPFVDRMKRTMPSLADGEAWIWSPSLLKNFVRIHIRERETFHGGATPGFEGSVEVVQARPDVSKLRKRLEAAAAVSASTQKVGTGQQIVKQIPCDHEAEIAALKGKVEQHEAHAGRLAEELRQFREEASAFQTIRHLLVGSSQSGDHAPFDEDQFLQRVLARIPRNGQVVRVTPPEALRKKYLDDTVQRVIEKIAGLSDDQRRAMEVLLSADEEWSPSKVAQAIHGKTAGSSGHVIKRWQAVLGKIAAIGLASKVGEGGRGGFRYRADVASFARGELSAHTPTDAELQGVVSHVLARLVS